MANVVLDELESLLERGIFTGEIDNDDLIHNPGYVHFKELVSALDGDLPESGEERLRMVGLLAASVSLLTKEILDVYSLTYEHDVYLYENDVLVDLIKGDLWALVDEFDLRDVHFDPYITDLSWKNLLLRYEHRSLYEILGYLHFRCCMTGERISGEDLFKEIRYLELLLPSMIRYIKEGVSEKDFREFVTDTLAFVSSVWMQSAFENSEQEAVLYLELRKFADYFLHPDSVPASFQLIH